MEEARGVYAREPPVYACYIAFNKARLSLCLGRARALRDALIFVIALSALSLSLSFSFFFFHLLFE